MHTPKFSVPVCAVIVSGLFSASISVADSANIDIPIRMGLKQAGSGFVQGSCEIHNQRPENGQRVLTRGSKTYPLVFRESNNVSGVATLSLEGLELGNQERLQYSYSCQVSGYRAVVKGERYDGRAFPGDNFIPRGAYFPGDDFVRRNDFYQDRQMSTVIRGNGEVMLRKRPSRGPN